jgi:hypothetical protein
MRVHAETGIQRGNPAEQSCVESVKIGQICQRAPLLPATAFMYGMARYKQLLAMASIGENAVYLAAKTCHLQFNARPQDVTRLVGWD